jgi:hypothetical protein
VLVASTRDLTPLRPGRIVIASIRPTRALGRHIMHSLRRLVFAFLILVVTVAGVGYGQSASAPTASDTGAQWIAGIANAPLTAGAVVGVTAEGQIGTLPAPTGPVSGSLLFLMPGNTAPAGYTLLGTTTLSIAPESARKATQLRVSVYQKN